MEPDRNFLNDDSIVRDARQYLEHLQRDASMRSGASPMLRSDEARAMMQKYRNEIDWGTWMTMKAVAAMNPVLDLAAAHAYGLIHYSKPRYRAVFRRIPVGTLATPDFTVSTTTAPAGGPVVLVPIGFVGAVHDIAERCAAASPYGGRPQVSHADAAAFIRRRLLYRPGGPWNEQPFRIRNFVKSVMTGGLGNDAVHFALAHEFAHVLKDLAGSVSRGSMAEYEADIIGSELALRAAAHPLNFQSSRRYGAAGVEVVLQATRLAEMLGVVAVQKSHPSASERLAVVHEHWKEAYGRRLVNFLKPLGDLFEMALAGNV